MGRGQAPLQAGRMDAQIAAAKPLQKRLWAEIVKSKLTQQAVVLKAIGIPPIMLTALIQKFGRSRER